MDRKEALNIYKAGRETVVETLLYLSSRIHELEQNVAALSRDSSNSSNPPSSDPPGKKKSKRKKKCKAKRKQGGQPGHKGKKRKLLPAEEMDKIHDIFPEHCECCQNTFSGDLLIPSAQPLRHQVFELPKIIPIKEEYRCHSLLCQCGHSTAASLPAQVSQSNFGPRTHATIAYLTTVHRVSRRGIAEIMQTLFGIKISTGAVCNATNRVSEACIPVVDGIKRYTIQSLVLNIDETGWKSQGDRRYLWTFVSPRTVLFQLDPSRGSKVLKKVLGETYPGIIGSDDFSAYSAYHKGLRQLCWAHIIRKLKALQDGRSSPHASHFAKEVLADINAIFSCWHHFLDYGGTREQLLLDTAASREKINDYCDIFRLSHDPLVRTRATRILAVWDHLFTFLEHEGVEPTNNIAERAIRPAVQWRKICFGSQSDSGERFTERLLSVVRTCQMNGANAFEVLVKIIDSASSKAPSLPSLPVLLPK